MLAKERMSEFQNQEVVQQKQALQQDEAIELTQKLLEIGYLQEDVISVLKSRGWTEEEKIGEIYSQAVLKNKLPQMEKRQSHEAEELVNQLVHKGYPSSRIKEILTGKGWSEKKAQEVFYAAGGSGSKETFELTKNLYTLGYAPKEIITTLQEHGWSEENAAEIYGQFSAEEEQAYILKLWHELKKEEENKQGGSTTQPSGRRIHFNPGHTRGLIRELPQFIGKENLGLHPPGGKNYEPMEGYLYGSLDIDELHAYLEKNPQKTDFLVALISRELAQYWDQIGGHVAMVKMGIERPAMLTHEKFRPRLIDSLKGMQADLKVVADQIEVVTEFIKPLSPTNELNFVELKRVVEEIEKSAVQLKAVLDGVDVSAISSAPEDNTLLSLLTIVSQKYDTSPYNEWIKRRTEMESERDLQKAS